MKKVAVLIICLFASIAHSQITIINTGTTDNLVSISKINNNLLISGFNTYLAKSYDNCNTLIPVNTPVFIDAPQDRFFRVVRLDTSHLFLSYKAYTNWKLYKSVDGGNTWQKKQDSTHANLTYVDPTLLFYDTINGSVMFDSNRAIYTTNALNTYSVGWWINGGGWNIYTTGPGAVAYGDSIGIFGETTYGGAFITKNRGKTWIQSSGVGGQPRDFEVVNKDTIYFISSPGTSLVGFFGYTFDGGLNWSYNTISDPVYFNNICVKNKNEVYVTAREGAYANGSGVILKTNDLGQTWSKFTTPFLADLRDMKFLKDSIALICGDNGLLFKWNTKTAVFVGVKEYGTDNSNIKIYPNPANDVLNIELNELKIKDYKLLIVNSFGQLIKEEEITFKNNSIQINTKAFANGVYLLNLKGTNSQTLSKRFLVAQ